MIMDLYRQRALECYSLADGLSDPDERRTMRKLALCWLDLLELVSKSPSTRDGPSRPNFAQRPSTPPPPLRPAGGAEYRR
jgi:hypothetical protein